MKQHGRETENARQERHAQRRKSKEETNELDSKSLTKVVNPKCPECFILV